MFSALPDSSGDWREYGAKDRLKDPEGSLESVPVGRWLDTAIGRKKRPQRKTVETCVDRFIWRGNGGRRPGEEEEEEEKGASGGQVTRSDLKL